MANFCERCKHAMSAHDNHASCPQCRVAAGVCSVDPKNPCTICEGWTRKQWARLRRSLIDARARAEQRGKQHWTVACPHVEAWILAKPGSTSASEISSQAGEGDFDDESLVGTPKQHGVQVLVVQTQNGANMAASSTSTAAGASMTAQSAAASTAAIVDQSGQDTPSVNQGALPERKYGSQPYFSDQQYTAASGMTAAQPCTAVNAAAQPYIVATQPHIAPYNNMPAMSARPAEPMGFFGQGGQLPFMLTEEQLLHQQQLLREKQEFDAWRASRAQAKTQSQPQSLSEAEVNIQVNVDSERSAGVARARPQDQITKQAKAKCAGSTSTSRRSPSPKRDYPRGTCTVTRPSQASPRKAEHTVAPAQDLEAFKADMTSMLSDMLQASFQRFASQFNTNSGGQGNNSKEDTIPKQVLSEPTVDVASDDDIENSPHRGPEDQSEGEITEGEADPAGSGLPTLEQLKMSKEEQQDYDAFSLASVSVPTRPWRAMGESRASQSQPPDNANVSQARPQAIAKAQSIKSSSSEQRSVQHHADQRQVQLRAPQDQANFPVLVPQGQGQRPVLGRPVVRRDDLDSLLDEEFSVDLDNEAVLKEKQARSEVLDKIAEFCNLNRQDPRVQKEVMGMRLPAYNAPTKKSIEVSLPWHSTTADIANLNNDIVRGKLNKSLKPLNPSKPWSPKEFFGASGYYIHNTHGYLAKPESLDFPSRAPPAERTAEDQPFFHVPRHPEEPRTRVNITSGSASLSASQLQDQETMSRKSAAKAKASTALSIAEYIDNYPGMPEGARAAMLLLKLDIISFLNYAWREVHNKMLLRRSIALDCLERTLPPIDQDQKLALLHAPFRGTTLFGGELAKLQEANTKRAATFTVFPQPTAPPTSYSTCPYAGRGKSFRDDKKGFKKPGGRGRGQGRPAPTATVTRPGQSKDSQKTLTVSTDSKKRKSESQEDAPQGPRKSKRSFRGDKNKGNKQ